MEFIIHRMLAAPLAAEDVEALVVDHLEDISSNDFAALMNLAEAATENVPTTGAVPATGVATGAVPSTDDDDDDSYSDEEIASGVCQKAMCVENESPVSSPASSPPRAVSCLPLEVARVKVVCRRAPSVTSPRKQVDSVPIFDVSDALRGLHPLKAWDCRQLNRQPAKCADTLEKTLELYERARKSPEMAYNFAVLDEELALRRTIADAFDNYPKAMRQAIFYANPMHDVRGFAALIKGFLRRNE